MGLICGSFTWGLIADIAGRKVAIAVATIGGTVTSLVAILAPNATVSRSWVLREAREFSFLMA